MLATQNTGQGDVLSECAGAMGDASAELEAMLSAVGVEVFMFI